MELRTLAYAEAVARLGTFTRAAQELHVAQPAVSAQIATLERELGVQLFVRTRRGVTPTDAGARVVEHARRMLDQAEQLRADVDELRGLLAGRLRVGITPLVGGLDVPAAVAAFHREHPGVALRIRSGLIDALLAELAAGELDAVVGPIDERTERRFEVTVLATETVVLISAPAAAVPRALADVADQAFVCLHAESGLRAILDKAAAAHGFVPNVAVEAATPWQIREYVSAGLGVALLAASVARAEGPPVRITVLDPSPAHPPLGVIRRPGGPRAAAAFAVHLSA
ncbi:LysR family transcriptional regulator [Labedaea rhizosphaerae]|uniref:DNA-binding transcriptional LysR family regulator n=1 Tax=Labedaea rhizosphaerae TaxID=598644 RepID=A0A4R6SAN7_LABRH|nr:LysR family transcriptional regulator [Labedaea rhizosphaerae]TDP96497.1 DNA-binding transcriptional LysR family regulator [Labedaea rhizosphaerae]